MGLVYYLLKKDKKELYDLGKSVGYLFDRYQTFKINEYNKYDGDLALRVHAECEHFSNYEECIKDKWFEKIANDIMDWCISDDIIAITDQDFGEKIFIDGTEIYGSGEGIQVGWPNDLKNSGNIYQNNDYLDEEFNKRYNKIENITVNFFQGGFNKQQLPSIIKTSIGTLILEDGYVDKVIGRVLDAKLKEIKDNMVLIEVNCEFYKQDYKKPTITMFPPDEEKR